MEVQATQSTPKLKKKKKINHQIKLESKTTNLLYFKTVLYK